MKDIEFLGNSDKQIRKFPAGCKKDIGKQLQALQLGKDPSDWKPLNTIGAGVREIRVRDKNGIFRVIYVAKFEEAIYILHVFQKKEQQTSKSDINLAKSRYKEITRRR